MIFILIWNLFFMRLINSLEIVKSSKALLSSNTNFIIPKNKCKEILIPNNFKKITLYLLSTEIDELLLTDKKINSCKDNQSILDCCNVNSTFCTKEVNPSDNYFHIYNCLESSYIYACGKNNNISSSLNVRVYVVKEEGCQIEENNDELKCASLGLSQCKIQINQCQYIECISENNEKLMELCLPSNFKDEEIHERCSNHEDFGENGTFNKLNFN